MAMTLLLGGVASGKSRTAVALATATNRPVTLIATAEALDEEMAARIERHRRERPVDWVVIEEPLALTVAVGSVDPEATLVLDCLTLWVSNLLGGSPEPGDDDVIALAAAAAKACAARAGATVVISNEVGAGIVPMHPLARRFRDLLGRVNGTFADQANIVALMVAGRAVRLSDPLTTLEGAR